MSALTTDEIVALAAVVVVAIVIVALMLYMMRRLRQRHDKLLGELHDQPRLARDRAFNRLAMARRESEILAQQGLDVSRPRDLIAQSQAALDLRDFDRTYQLAQQAHEALVSARRDARLPSVPTASPARSTGAPLPGAGAATTTAGPAPEIPPRPGIPKNRAESQFQLRLLDQELEGARRDRPMSAATQEAVKVRADAGAAFDRGDFTDAFRLALRGRRTLGTVVEGLPAAATGGGVVSVPNGIGGVPDPSRTAEQVAGADRCAECGYPALPGDAFCRGCGVPRRPSACPQCGEARVPTDTFCGRCGAPFR